VLVGFTLIICCTFINDIASEYYFSALSSSCDQFLRCKSDIEEKWPKSMKY